MEEQGQVTASAWCRRLVILLIGVLLGCVLVVALVDPFEIYHRAWGYTPPYRSETQSYSNAGIARQYAYDSVIIGSSVTENCRPSVYAEELGGRFVKLCMNGGMSADHARMLKLAFETHSLRRVVYGIDLFAFNVYYTNQKMRTPDYLYSLTVLDDAPYWFNRDVWFTEIPEALGQWGETPQEELAERMYSWDPPWLPGAQGLIGRLQLGPWPQQQEYDPELTRGCVEHNLLPFIRAHPETRFDLFFPPYSRLYWVNEASQGRLEEDLGVKMEVVRMLLDCGNVRLFDFQMDPGTQDYDRYYDLIHYLSGVNDDLARDMAGGRGQITSLAEVEQGCRQLARDVREWFDP